MLKKKDFFPDVRRFPRLLMTTKGYKKVAHLPKVKMHGCGSRHAPKTCKIERRVQKMRRRSFKESLNDDHDLKSPQGVSNLFKIIFQKFNHEL